MPDKMDSRRGDELDETCENEVVDRYELRVADVARVELDVLCPMWGHDGKVFP